MTTSSTQGRGWAYTGAILGGLVSVAANVAHSFIAPAGAPSGWQPQPGAVVGAIVWPVFLFVAVEILARYTWPAGGWWTLLRFGGMTPVTLVAAFVSYRHLSGLLTYYGEDTLIAFFGPLAVDGLMVMATGAILATGARTRHITTTTTTNTASVTAPAVPAKPSTTTEPATAATPVVASVSPVSTPTPVPVPAASVAPGPSATVSPSPPPAPRESATPVATLAPVTVPVAPAPTAAASASTLVTTADAAPPIGRPVPAALLTRARHLAQAHHASTGSPITAGELAVRLRVNSDTATQVLAVLDLAPDHPNRPAATVNGHPVGARK